MKLKPEHVVYVRSMGKALRITHIARSTEEANTISARDSSIGVIAEFDGLVWMANVYDPGVRIDESRAERAR